MVEFTCNVCGTKYNIINGETDERMCNNCFEYDDILDDENEKEIKWIPQNIIRLLVLLVVFLQEL